MRYLPERRTVVLEALAQRPHTARELERLAGTAKRGMFQVLNELRDAGKITLVGHTQQARWGLVGDPRLKIPETRPAYTPAPIQPVLQVVKRADLTPSWWVGLDRTTLETQAHAKAAQMSSARIASAVRSTGLC